MNQKELLDKWAKTHVHIKDFEEWKKVDPYFFGYENHGSDLEDFSKFVISQQQEAYKINYVKCPKCENTQYRKSMMDKGLCTCCGESVKFLNPFEIYKQKLEARFIATVEEFFDANIAFWDKRVNDEQREDVLMSCVLQKAEYEVDKDKLLKRLSLLSDSDKVK